MLEGLLDLKRKLSKHPCVGDIRGKGLMIGLELVISKKKKDPNPDMVKSIREKCLQKGLLLIFCGAHGQVIRLIPPLIITKA